MSKQSRLNKEKAALAKASQDKQGNRPPQQAQKPEMQRDQHERNEGRKGNKSDS